MSAVPDIIGPYEVIRAVAQGGMAEVFEVRDPASGERLALKLLVEMKSNIKRFNREFEAMTRLNHPGIVRVFRYGYHGRNPWITMELLEGTPLQSRVKSFGPPGTPSRTEEVVRIGFFIANALQYIHDRGLVHRDLKSANVQVLPDGRIKIIDFGTAHLSDPLERITADGDFIGTFSYAAPEQLLGSKVDHRADLYSLGVLLYRLTTGRRPFKASDPRKVARMHLEKAPRPPREFVPEVPEDLDRLILWMLEKKRGDRPQQASEIAAVLEEIAGRPLTLPGQGIAVLDDRSVGRDTTHRRAWALLHDEEHPVEGLIVHGGDRSERGRFARQLGRDAAKRGWRCIVCSASSSPLVAVASALRAVVEGGDDPETRDLTELLRDVSYVPSDLVSDLLDEARSVALSYLEASESVPTILVLEELARFDSESFRVATAFVSDARAAGHRLILVGTAETVMSNGVEAVARAVDRLEMLELVPLDVWNTALAVGGLLHRRPPPPEPARRIFEATGGRPTYVEDIVREMVSSGAVAVRSDDGNRINWEARLRDGGVRSQGAIAEVEARVASFPAPARRMFEVIAELEGAGGLPRLAKGMGWGEVEASVVLDDLCERGELRRLEDGYHFEAVDRLLVRYIAFKTSPARRELIHSRLIHDIERDEPSIVQVRFLQSMGLSERSLAASIPCVRQLLEAGRGREALELVERMATVASHPGLSRSLRAKFHLVHAAALQLARPRDPQIARVLRKAEETVDSAAGRAEVRLGFAELQRSIGHAVNYRRMLEEAWEETSADSRNPIAVEVALRLGEDQRHAGQVARAGQWYERALSRSIALGDLEFRDRARVGLGDLMLARGRGKDAAMAFRKVAESSDASPTLQWIATAGWAEAVRRQGRFSEVIARLERALVETRKGPSSYAHARVLLTLARIELDLFRLGRADEFIDEVLGAQPQGERLELRLETRYVQGRVQLASGQLGRATMTLQEVVERADPAGLLVIAERARAELAYARWHMGDRREAAQLFRRAYQSLRDTGHLEAFSDVVVARARALAGAEDPTRCFAPVQELLDRSGFRVLYLEHLLAEYRWHRHRDNDPLSRQSLREAQAVLGRLAARQHRIEQAAMRVHPWTKEIKRALT